MSENPGVRTRDIVVIGTSAGGVEALPKLLHVLPPDFPAAVFVVLHMAPNRDPQLVNILSRGARVPISWADQGERFHKGRVYIAPPDVHLMFTDDHVRLARTARENHARPSIDKLFRSAAATHGSRVIGVLLTGMLDDGVAGLRAIREAGGFVVVQDPEDAQFPELPSRALLAVAPDRTMPAGAIGALLTKVAGVTVARTPIPEAIALESQLDYEGPVMPDRMHALGPQVSVPCPECNGPMWNVGDEKWRRYRCFIGHASSAREILEQSSTRVEAALWSAVRALVDRASTLEALAADAQHVGNGASAEGYASRAREAREQAELARTFMFELIRPS